MNSSKNLFKTPDAVINKMIHDESVEPFEEKVKKAREESLIRLKDPTIKAIVLELLERKGISVIESMGEKELQSEASNNDSLNDYIAAQLRADCEVMQGILDKKEEEEIAKYTEYN